MSIAWNYLDKRSAAMAALKDYCSMKAILATTAEEIANVRQHELAAEIFGAEYS